MGEKIQSDFLFAQPSLGSGVARALDLFGVFDEYNHSESAAEADAKAVAADWLVVGQEIAEAIRQEEASRAA